MNKLLAITALVIVILALWSFNASFVGGATNGSASGTSAVIFVKAGSVSVRVQFIVIPQAGTIANITLPDGSQIRDIASSRFEVFLPKNGSVIGHFSSTSVGNITLSSQKPCGATVIPNVTDSLFNSIQGSEGVTVYSFKVQGMARVTIAWFGVGV